MQINLYPEMNCKIAGILRLNDEHKAGMYAAALIDQLQAENAELLQKTQRLEADRDAWKRRAEAAEPRILTLEELQGYYDVCPVLWVETLHSFSVVVMDGKWEGSIIAKNTRTSNYGVSCRCWTSRPTPEQSERAPWEGPRDEGKEEL